MEKLVTVNYPAGHSYDYTYTKTDLYCPICGQRGIWVEDGEGDYYLGTKYICVEGKHGLHLPSCAPADSLEMQIVDQLTDVSDLESSGLISANIDEDISLEQMKFLPVLSVVSIPCRQCEGHERHIKLRDSWICINCGDDNVLEKD